MWFCARPDGTKHGAFVTQFPGGATQIAGTYKDGVLDGPWERHHPNGALAEIGAYAAGQKHGAWRQLAANGKPLGNYTLAHGTGTERRWLDDGTLYSEIAFKTGIEHGPAKYFTADGGLVASTRFVNGKLDGAQTIGTKRSMLFEIGRAA